MRLIDADAAIDAIESKTYRHTYLDQIVGIINDLPTITLKNVYIVKGGTSELVAGVSYADGNVVLADGYGVIRDEID